ncbi:MAG: serine/threonine protein kinase [Labilithrix sp.]|nr:serine/threonine protein kinase [Labilithrix sp.]
MPAAQIDIDELAPGAALGPYDLVAPIGAGGMARVWAARVRGKGDVVALKMLLPNLSENIEFRKMFFDEANIASRVHHPNVCRTHALDENDGLLYLAMEWIDGPSLMRVLRPGREDVTEAARIPIRPRVAARIVADACAGLHAAHELRGDGGRSLGVVHRDVSPHNLLLTTDGNVKITDFGVAKAIGKSHMTIAGQLKGKLAYMAPEQLTGGAVDRRTDVFALGCVLYEITTGQRPFQGEHDPQVMTAIMMGHYEPPGTIVANYPHELAIVVMRALSNEPEHRYPSAEHMRQGLETYLRNSGPAVGTQQVADLIRERCGAEVSANHARVLGAAPPPPPRASVTNESGSALDIGGPPAQSRGALYIVTAALVGAAMGVGVLAYVRSVRKAKAQAVHVAPPAASTAATTLMELPSTHGRVHLTITPSTAIVVVDGVVLPRGTDTIARPTNGLQVMVLVRADKHDDKVVLVDGSTPDEVAVALSPAATPQGLTSVGASLAENTSATVAPAPPAPKPKPLAPREPKEPKEPVQETPPNPY